MGEGKPDCCTHLIFITDELIGCTGQVKRSRDTDRQRERGQRADVSRGVCVHVHMEVWSSKQTAAQHELSVLLHRWLHLYAVAAQLPRATHLKDHN